MISNSQRLPNSHILIETPKEELNNHIDRLNRALSIAMQEIEITPSNSRVSSRFSIIQPEIETRPESPSFRSEDLNLPYEFEQKIEELLQTIDRSQMVIEDFISAEHRRETSTAKQTKGFQPVNEIGLSLRVHKNEIIEKERKNFEEKLEALDSLKEEYLKKKNEVVDMYQKLNEKERLLDAKEKELRASRMAFDRHRMLWEQKTGAPIDDDMPTIKPPKYPVETSVRASLPKPFQSTNSLRSSLPSDFSFKSIDSVSITQNGAPPLSESLDFLQEDLRQKTQDLESLKKNPATDTSKLEMQIDQLKNRIATLRGEKVMMMSNQTSRILSNIVHTMQKQNLKEDQEAKRKELIEKINSKNESKEVFTIKQLEARLPEKTETKRRFLFSDAPTPKNINTPRTSEKEDPYKVYFENKKALVQEKERILNDKEKLLKDVFREILMKYPDAQEIIDNLKKKTKN